jgi:hypothetical protein
MEMAAFIISYKKLVGFDAGIVGLRLLIIQKPIAQGAKRRINEIE